MCTYIAFTGCGQLSPIVSHETRNISDATSSSAVEPKLPKEGRHGPMCSLIKCHYDIQRVEALLVWLYENCLEQYRQETELQLDEAPMGLCIEYL